MPLLRFIPNWLLALLVGRMFAAEAKHPKPTGVNDYQPIVEIAPSVQFDFRIVADTHGHADVWRAITTEVAAPQRREESGVSKGPLLPLFAPFT